MSEENNQQADKNLCQLYVETKDEQYIKLISNNIDDYRTDPEFSKIPIDMLYPVLERSRRFNADEAVSIINDISNNQKVPVEIISHINLSNEDRDKVLSLMQTLNLTKTVNLSINDLQTKLLDLESKFEVFERSYKSHITDDNRHFVFWEESESNDINVMDMLDEVQYKLDTQMAYIQAIADHLNIELTLNGAVVRSRSALKGDINSELNNLEQNMKKKAHEISPTKPVNLINNIYKCCEKGILSNIKWLIYENPKLVETKDSTGKLPIHYAAKKGYINILQLLVLKGSLIDDKDNNENTPLHLCAQNGHREACEFLIKKGADIKALNKMGWSPLRHASHEGYLSVCELLVSYGGDINEKNERGTTHLYSAAQNGHVNVCKFFIEKGCNINDTNVNGFTAMHIAAQEGHLDVCELLFANGALVDEKSTALLTPLQLSAMNNHYDIVSFLIDKGAFIDAQNSKLSTALHLASKYGFTDVCKLLLAKGANPNLKDSNGHTVLYIASDKGHQDLCKLLMANGAKLT